MKRLLPYLKSLIQALLLFILISVAVDWWRKPNQPMQASSESLHVINGNSTSLETLSKERIAVVYFWGTWCHICSYTSPTIDRLHQNGIPALGVAVHSGPDTEIQTYMKEHQLQFPTVNDSDDQLAANWKIAVTPTIILIKKRQNDTSHFRIEQLLGLTQPNLADGPLLLTKPLLKSLKYKEPKYHTAYPVLQNIFVF